MPMVRVDTTDEWTQKDVLAAGEVIYEVLMDVFSVPENDKFQIINRHPKVGLNVAPNFHGNEYSEKLLIIQIFFSKNQKIKIARWKSIEWSNFL